MSYTHYKDVEPFYDDSDEKIALLQKRIAEYFKNPTHWRKVKLQDGTMGNFPRYAIAKLAFALGFKDRQSLYDIRKRNKSKRVADEISRAMLWIEGEYEERLQEGNCVGIIFALKNMGWKDSQEITVDDLSLTEEDKKKRRQRLAEKYANNNRQ